MKAFSKIITYRDITPCSSLKNTQISEENFASIFKTAHYTALYPRRHNSSPPPVRYHEFYKITYS
jgi:hypothetical protein